MPALTTKGFTATSVPKQRFHESVRNNSDLIVTPLYDEYLLEHPEIPNDEEIIKKVIGLLSEAPRDRRRSFSASQAGYCLRRQELAFIGIGKKKIDDPRGARIFQNGTFVHLRWQIGLLAAQIISGIEVTTDMNGGLFRATMDGVGKARRGRYKGVRFGWEHKGRMSFSYAAQERNGADAKTRKQVAMQMLLSDYEVWSITNENKDTQHASEFVIERNEEEIADARDELHELASAIEHAKLHPMLKECVKQNVTGEFYKCPFGTPTGPCCQVGSWPNIT